MEKKTEDTEVRAKASAEKVQKMQGAMQQAAASAAQQIAQEHAQGWDSLVRTFGIRSVSFQIIFMSTNVRVIVTSLFVDCIGFDENFIRLQWASFCSREKYEAE